MDQRNELSSITVEKVHEQRLCGTKSSNIYFLSFQQRVGPTAHIFLRRELFFQESEADVNPTAFPCPSTAPPSHRLGRTPNPKERRGDERRGEETKLVKLDVSLSISNDGNEGKKYLFDKVPVSFIYLK